MEPLERSVSHNTDTESVDTVTTNQSLGPALVGNISVDSLDDHSSIVSNQPAQRQQDTDEPRSQKPSEQEPELALDDKLRTTGLEKELDVRCEKEQSQLSESAIHVANTAEEQQPSEAGEQASLDEHGQALTQEPDQEDNEREQQLELEQDSLQDRSARMSISTTSDGNLAAQVQGIEREKLAELAHQIRQEIEDEESDREDSKEEKVEVTEQKVDFIEEGLKQESSEPQENQQRQDEGQEQQQLLKEESINTSISLIKLHDTSGNELFHHTFKTAVNTSQDSRHFADGEEDKISIMEFAKNYSDDLISNEAHRAPSGENNNDSSAGGHDLADFELPPYSGSSSSTSDQAGTKHSPAKQRKSSNSMATQASSSYQAPGSNASAVAHDLSAVKNVLKSTYARFSHVFQWRRPIESGIIFGIGLTLIVALTFFSIISVVAYSALGIICASGLLRIYKTGMKALSRSTETPVDHLWDKALSLNVSLSPERLHELVDTSHANLNASMVYFKQVLLVEDKFATFKFSLFLYSLTYIGAWFNGLTLITLVYVALFSVPLFYEKNNKAIDEYINLATKQISSSMSMVTDRVGSILGSQMGGTGSKKQN